MRKNERVSSQIDWKITKEFQKILSGVNNVSNGGKIQIFLNQPVLLFWFF